MRCFWGEAACVTPRNLVDTENSVRCTTIFRESRQGPDQRGFRIPIFFIREVSVDGLIPRISAAPPSP